MENNYKNYDYELKKINNASIKGDTLSYEQAMEVVRKSLEKKIEKEYGEKSLNANKEKKDKEYLRRKKEKFRKYIEECILEEMFTVTGIEIENFKDEMVAEFAGYSVLEGAFADPKVSDIYVIEWNNIYVERDGRNLKYTRNFRSPEHFERVLKNFLSEAGTAINSGDTKIVDFELFQDRGCAIHPMVSTKGYSLTFRKHTEEHITRDQLIMGKVVDEKLMNLLGILILGETNMICAGVTGSGKTTTIRAILDYYVTKANKRMLVCEDTQELFLKNEHTLEMVSMKSDEANLAVSLQTLIYTALRQKPDYIVVGEVRGMEAEAAVEAMETGHSTIFTMHGDNPWNIINRLVTKYLTAMPTLGKDVAERKIGSAVDYIFIQDHIPNIGRRISSLHEISYDFEEKKLKIKPICEFDFTSKEWVWLNKLSKDKITKMLRRGIPIETLKPWIE